MLHRRLARKGLSVRVKAIVSDLLFPASSQEQWHLFGHLMEDMSKFSHAREIAAFSDQFSTYWMVEREFDEFVELSNHIPHFALISTP